jgi:serine/threonine protein kinase
MIGKTISHYKIVEKLGEGGMGVVYKAQDTKLDRFVALKFLPAHLAASEQDKARFIQEAKSTSALNHPNVCTIHDIQEYEGQLFIVMEFIDGQTLQERKSSLTMKQAIDFGIQIAEGLAAAHEKGIVHRDVKPENIMIRKDGIVQVMDFGLAKLAGVSRLTKAGSTVGTLGYMSPEQVQGQQTDHRSDIFSFGVLLYEMITGASPFSGAHESAILYEIVNVDVPPPSSKKTEIDPELDRIVLECMEKDPNERMQSIKQVAIDLNRFKRTSSRSRMSRTFSTSTMPTTVSATTSHDSLLTRRRLPWAITGFVLLSAVIWTVFLSVKGIGPHGETIRLNLSAVNAKEQFIYRSDIPSIAISPDGRLLIFTLSEGGAYQLYLRSLNSFQSTPIKGTTNGTSPFFSPDGQWIGFTADGKIKKVPTAGGAVETIADAPGFRGAAWGTNNRIYFSSSFASGLSSVAATGGEVKTFSTLDSTRKERSHRWPQVLPDGKWVLYTVGDQNNPNSYVDAALVIQSTESAEYHELDVRGETARYFEPGFLVVARNGALLVAPFSLKDFRTTKPPATMVSEVNGDPGSGVSDFAVSGNGHLVYLSGTLNKDLELVWVTRDGKVTPFPLPPQAFNTPRLSPDGTRLAMTLGLVAGSDNDVWIYDLKKLSLHRLTFGKKMFDPVWSRDGRKIYLADATEGKEGLLVQASDGSSEGISLLRNPMPRFPISVTPDGKRLIINTLGGPSDGDIVALDLDKPAEPQPVFVSSIYEYGGNVSPDGRFIVYGSNETGTLEVYVQSYPDLKGKWQISVNGGLTPLWSGDGKEIFYINTVGKMMVASVRTAPAFSSDQPRELFDVSQMYFPNNPITNFDVTRDGKRFVMVRNTKNSVRSTSFNVVLNWTDELQRAINGNK